MKNVFDIECYKLKRHPLVMIILSLCLGVLSLLFYRLCVDYLQKSHLALHQRDIEISVFVEIIKPLCSWTVVVMALVLPLLTLYSFSQEYRQNTFYLWAMSPLKAKNIVIGKWLSLMLILTIILLFLLCMICTLAFTTTLNWQQITLSLITVYLVGACLLSFGLFISSCFANPVLALGITYVAELAWMMLQWLNPLPDKLHFLAKEFSLLIHCHHAFLGILYSPDIVFFILMSTFWISLTIRQVSHKMTSITP